MNSKLKFNKLYFVPALSLLAIEILIAKFANAVGLLKFFLRRRARNYEIIEYK